MSTFRKAAAGAHLAVFLEPTMPFGLRPWLASREKRRAELWQAQPRLAQMAHGVRVG
jgi:hypothetical protein